MLAKDLKSRGFSIHGFLNHTRLLVFTTGLIMYSGLVAADWVEWIADVAVDAQTSDNINRTSFKEDERADRFVEPKMSLGRNNQLSDFTRLRLTADINTARHNKYSLLDYTSQGLAFSLRHKFGLGLQVPWIGLAGSFANANYRDNNRDSTINEMGLQFGKRISPRVDIVAELAGKQRRSDDSTVFDQDSRRFSLTANTLLKQNLLLSLGYAHRRGEFNASCNGDNIGQVLAAVPDLDFHLDEAFRNDPAKPFCVYQLDGTANFLSAFLSYALNGHNSMNLGYEFQRGSASGFVYENNIWRASYIYAY